MKTNPLEQAFRRNRAIRKYADGALVTAETGQVPAITNVGTGMASLGDMMTDQPVDIATALEAIINPNQLAATQALSEIPLISQQAFAPQPIQTAQTAQPMSITSAGGLGGGGLGGITYEQTSPIVQPPSGTTTGGTTGVTTGGTTPTTTTPRTRGDFATAATFAPYEPYEFKGQIPTDLTRFVPVFDPRTGRKFDSPAMAKLYGVEDYVYSTPRGLPKPERFANVPDQELADRAAGYGVSLDAYLNYYRNLDANKAQQTKFDEMIKTQSGGLSPQELTAKLEYYKANPPKTNQERQEQSYLWADYSNRYANSNWNYSNMGGMPMNYELKPADTFMPTVTGYSNTLDQIFNEYGSNINTLSDYNRIRETVANNPSIDRVLQNVENILGKNPFPNVNTADALIRNFDVEQKRIGSGFAESNFYQSLAHSYEANQGDWTKPKNADPVYMNLLRAADAAIPVANNQKWEQVALNSQGANPPRIIWRDPQTGKGFGYEKDKGGYLLTYDTYGRPTRGFNTRNAGDILLLLQESGLSPQSLKSFNDTLKKNGVDMAQTGLNVDSIANGTTIAQIASDKYVQDMMAHYDKQQEQAKKADFATAGEFGRQQYMKDILAQQAAAKALLGQPTQTTPAAKDGGAVMMKHGGPVDLEKEFRLADMIDMKGVGSAKKFDEGGKADKSESKMQLEDYIKQEDLRTLLQEIARRIQLSGQASGSKEGTQAFGRLGYRQPIGDDMSVDVGASGHYVKGKGYQDSGIDRADMSLSKRFENDSELRARLGANLNQYMGKRGLDELMLEYEMPFKNGGDVELEKEFKGKSRLIPKAVIDALNTKRKLSPAEAKIAGQYAKPENQWDVGSILEEIDPVYTLGRGAETLKNVDYGAIKDLLLQRYQLEKDPRKALEKELGQLGDVAFGALDVAPAGAILTKPAKKALKELAQKFEGVPVGLSIKDVTPVVSEGPSKQKGLRDFIRNIEGDEGKLKRSVAYNTYEQVPYVGSRHLEGMTERPFGEKLMFTEEAPYGSEEKNADLLADYLGLKSEPSQKGIGLYTPPIEGASLEMNPQISSRTKVKTDQERRWRNELTPESEGSMTALGATRGYLDVQGASPWVKPSEGGKRKYNSFHISLDGKPTESEMKKLAEIQDKYGFYGTSDLGKSGVFVGFNFDYGLKDLKNMKKSFEADVKDALGDRVKGVKMVKSEGDYPGFEGKWEEPQGSGAVTRQLMEYLDAAKEKNPMLAEFYAQRPSTELQKLMQEMNIRDIKAPERYGVGAPREDVMKARDIFAEYGLEGLRDALNRGEYLPAAVAVPSGIELFRDDN